jgi:hypothetical protein
LVTGSSLLAETVTLLPASAPAPETWLIHACIQNTGARVARALRFAALSPGSRLCEPTLSSANVVHRSDRTFGAGAHSSARTRLKRQALDDLSSRLAIGCLDLGLEPVVKRAKRQRHRRSTRKKPSGWRAGHRFGVDLASGADAVVSGEPPIHSGRTFAAMERTGIEPVTSGLQSRRSPS